MQTTTTNILLLTCSSECKSFRSTSVAFSFSVLTATVLTPSLSVHPPKFVHQCCNMRNGNQKKKKNYLVKEKKIKRTPFEINRNRRLYIKIY